MNAKPPENLNEVWQVRKWDVIDLRPTKNGFLHSTACSMGADARVRLRAHPVTHHCQYAERASGMKPSVFVWASFLSVKWASHGGSEAVHVARQEAL